MTDLANPKLMWLKGSLLIVAGLLSALLLLLRAPGAATAALIVLLIWSWCRAYYFAFYVIEHYIDPSFRFSGLWSFAGYMWKQRR